MKLIPTKFKKAKLSHNMLLALRYCQDARDGKGTDEGPWLHTASGGWAARALEAAHKRGLVSKRITTTVSPMWGTDGCVVSITEDCLLWLINPTGTERLREEGGLNLY